MAKKIKVTKFGDYEEHVSATEKGTVNDTNYDVNTVTAQSDVHLEDDKGIGHAVIMRVFEFASNPVAFKLHTPTKQELFDSHAKQIETMLWGDGLVAMSEVNPTVTISKKKDKYRILVGAEARGGVAIADSARTLSQLIKK